jgi:predicted  nucleic acid-binding Zn ribbon protein
LYILGFVIYEMARIDYNNYKHRNSITCPKCGNKTQFVKMGTFDKSKYICNICGWSEYWFKVLR